MRHRLVLGEQAHDVWLSPASEGERLLVGDAWHTLGPMPADAVVIVKGDTAHIHLHGRAYLVRLDDPVDRFAATAASGGDAHARAPMPGSVVSAGVMAGDAVSSGDAMMVIESMKMETVIRAPRDGVVETVHVAIGDSFDRDAVLVTLVAEED